MFLAAISHRLTRRRQLVILSDRCSAVGILQLLSSANLRRCTKRSKPFEGSVSSAVPSVSVGPEKAKHESNSRTMRIGRHGPFALLITTVAVFSWQPVPFCRAEFRLFSSSSKKEKEEEAVEPTDTPPTKTKEKEQCPFYGCSLLPIDVHYSPEDIKEAFEQMRSKKRVSARQSAAARKLSSASTDEHVTLTLIGYKGGLLKSPGPGPDRVSLFDRLTTRRRVR